MGIRKIIHLDLDAFFCAVEELRHPELTGKPFAVGGRPNERGVVASCSYAARALGVHSAMPMGQALGVCPGMIIVPPNHHLYSQASEQVMAILRGLTPLVEQLSIDEAFLDVSDLPQPVAEIARSLQADIHRQTRLPCSLGVAANKLVAKMATDHGKAARRGAGDYPKAILVIEPGREAEFLAPLPTLALWGIGPKTAARLASYGIHTLGEIAALPEKVLTGWFGRTGRDLALRARGLDDRPVVVEHAIKSVSQEVTFERDISSLKILDDTLRSMSEQVAFRLRRDGICGVTIRLKLRWPDFTTLTRQITLPRPTDQDDLIYGVARELFSGVWHTGQAVRLLGVGVAGLSECAYQPSLWESPTDKERRLLEAIDELRQRFGDQAIRRGREFNQNSGR